MIERFANRKIFSRESTAKSPIENTSKKGGAFRLSNKVSLWSSILNWPSRGVGGLEMISTSGSEGEDIGKQDTASRDKNAIFRIRGKAL
jgi:hypothetical protein